MKAPLFTRWMVKNWCLITLNGLGRFTKKGCIDGR